MNNSSSVGNATDEQSEIIRIFNYIVYSIVVLLGVPGNILVIWSLMSIRRELVDRSYKILVINLAVNDILLVLSTLFTIAETATNQFPFGPVMCVVLYPLQTAWFGAGVFSMVALNFHRYYLIRYSRNGSIDCITVVVVILCWVIPTLITAVPYAAHLKLKDGTSCGETWGTRSTKAYTIYLFIVQYLLPLVIIATLNTQAIKRLRRGREFRVHSAKMSEENLHAHRRIVKMLIYIVIIFALFGLPGQIMWLIPVFVEVDDNKNYGTILSLIDVFPFMYCVLNPVLFFVYNKECKEKLKKFLSTAFFCCEHRWRSHRLSSQTALRTGTDAVLTLLPNSRTSDSQDTSQSDAPRIDPFAPAFPKHLVDKYQRNCDNTSNSAVVCNGVVRHGLLTQLKGLYGTDGDFPENSAPPDVKQVVFPLLNGSTADRELFRGSFMEMLKTSEMNSDLLRRLEASPETAIIGRVCETPDGDDGFVSSDMVSNPDS